MIKIKHNKQLAIFLAVFFLSLGQTCKYVKAETIYHDANEFGSLWVKQNGNNRYISFSADDKAIQSLINVQQPTIIQLEYIKMMLASLLLQSNCNDILIIGLGGGTIPSALNKLLPDSKTDIVEINPLIVEVAQNFFSFKSNKNTKIHITDGYKFIEHAKLQSYDLIIVDAFGRNYIPPQFLTVQFANNLKKRLKPNGIVAVNSFVNVESYEAESNLWNNAFSNTVNINDNYNRIIFAFKGVMPSKQQILNNLYKRAFSLYSVGIDTKWLTQRFIDSSAINSKLNFPVIMPVDNFNQSESSIGSN